MRQDAAYEFGDPQDVVYNIATLLITVGSMGVHCSSLGFSVTSIQHL